MPSLLRQLVRDALARLGIRRLLLGVHDAAFPSRPGEELGRGTPHADGAADLLALAHRLGFDGLQLGPQGATAPGNPSPYDGAFFSRNRLSVGLAELTREEWGELLPAERLAAVVEEVAARPDRVDYPRAFAAVEGLLGEAVAAFRSRLARGEGREVGRIAVELARFRSEAAASWLERDALHECLRRERGAPLGDAPRWAEVARDLERFRSGREAELEAYALVQLLLAAQHRRFRVRAHALGLELFGDLQVGMSERDAWAARDVTLEGWRMGAPPSRTNPEGQAWNYPVLDPGRYREGEGPAFRDGPAMAFFRARLRRVFEDYDGVRIDHPHGLVCPWVYPVGPDPDRAVREGGARLFESPDVPALAPHAIARPEQLDHGVPRHADGWVRWLEPAQVARYAALVDVLVAEGRRQGHDRTAIAAEVLSTQPLPLREVIDRHGLGRFRVTQKADLQRPDDGYRGENAAPEDWIQMATHDTPTVWAVAARWVASGESRARAGYLAGRVLPAGAEREAWAARAAGDRRVLVQAQLADLFVGPAANVMIFFTDLFGSEEPYNRPGTTSAANWAQRVPREPAEAFRALHRAGRALDLPGALALALRARGLDDGGLAAALDGASRSFGETAEEP